MNVRAARAIRPSNDQDPLRRHGRFNRLTELSNSGYDWVDASRLLGAGEVKKLAGPGVDKIDKGLQASFIHSSTLRVW